MLASAWEAALLCRGKKLEADSSSSAEPQWQEGAGGLLLVAAAQKTGLLSTLETAVSTCTPCADSRLAHLSARSRHMLVRTLLFLGAVGLERTWDLRTYTGNALGMLTDRSRAYGYFHTERFLSQVAQADGADTFTDGLAQWTARLWKPPAADLILVLQSHLACEGTYGAGWLIADMH